MSRCMSNPSLSAIRLSLYLIIIGLKVGRNLNDNKGTSMSHFFSANICKIARWLLNVWVNILIFCQYKNIQKRLAAQSGTVHSPSACSFCSKSTHFYPRTQIHITCICSSCKELILLTGNTQNQHKVNNKSNRFQFLECIVIDMNGSTPTRGGCGEVG